MASPESSSSVYPELEDEKEIPHRNDNRKRQFDKDNIESDEDIKDETAKRRKTTPVPIDDSPEFVLYDYIVLAEVSLAASLPEPNKSVTTIRKDELLTIKNVSALSTLPILTVFTSQRKSFDVKVRGALQPPDRQVLDDCNKVSAATPAISKGQTPLACHHITLQERDGNLMLKVQLLWHESPYLRDGIDPSWLDILQRYLPSPGRSSIPSPEPWQPRDFYDNVHVPVKTPQSSEPLKIGAFFNTELYPFQRRTVRWMLSREGVSVDQAGNLSPSQIQNPRQLPQGFFDTRGLHDEQQLFVNHVLGVVSQDFPKIKEIYGNAVGGLLAEEMGLGKTLGVIATVCLHQRSDVDRSTPISRPRRIRATLIITPPTILEQWKQEIADHAPGLSVYHYEGMKGAKLDFRSMVSQLSQIDIVLTTYNVIAREVHYVMEKPDRQLRRKPVRQPPKSPLTEVDWWRVCLDEAQMVESGVSAAATVARLIPRQIGWAVTGTPLRKGHRDLFGLLIFLRYYPWSYSAKLWDHLVNYHRPLFRSMIHDIAIRHTKDSVREDLHLPPQSRHTITLPFSAVEEQHYDHLFSQMCEEIGLDAEGAPIREEWDPDDPSNIEQMRRWLVRLRQTCLHPEVGVRNKRALGRYAGPLRTVQQVLDVMIDQTESGLRTEQRSLLVSQIRRGQMQENARQTHAALDLWKSAYEESIKMVDDCRQQLDVELALVKATNTANTNDDEHDAEGDEESDSRLQTSRQRLRSALEVKHTAVFFIANAYYQLKSDETNITPDSEEFHSLEKEETVRYEEAKAVRGELLFEVLRKANRLITKIKEQTKSGLTLPHMEAPDEQYTGIESRKIFEKLDIFCEAMNKQADYFESLRQKMVDFLKQALIDEDEGVELQGDEYESSTKHQDEMYAYMEALRAQFADRSDAITGQENLLIKQEMKQFLRSAKEGQGPAPDLMLKLLAERQTVHIDTTKLGSLRGIIGEIRQLVSVLQFQEAGGMTRAKAELAIATKVLHDTQALNTKHSKSLGLLEQEVNLFRDTMNVRLDYYRALQKISDTVAPFDEASVGEPLDVARYNSIERGEQTVAEKVSVLTAKRRYLMHLKNESSSDTPRLCTICQSDFEIGTLTVCGHQFCKECIQLWWHEHRTCPICKRRLHTKDFHDITYRPAEIVIQAEKPASTSEDDSPVSSSDGHNQFIYSDISTATLNEIKNIELEGEASYGSKVDMLLRHIFWLRKNDPGTKSIIFSQYRDFLDVLGRAMTQFSISHTAFDDKRGIEKFKSDPSVECFLLHAKAHSAGLNLVVASHVFLCEPLLATAVELQAIARVHRIGQHRATTVWMYIIGGTVEESIYEMSVTRRLEHMKRSVKRFGKSKSSALSSSSTSRAATPNQEDVIDAANSLELQAADLSKLMATGKSGGELVDKQDLWQCLFGKVRRKEAVMNSASESAMGRLLRAEAAEVRSLVGPSE